MAVAHAVTVGEYPELNYQHSWDSINYCMNNSQGCRGTITFGKKYIIAVFQDTSVKMPYQDAMNFFKRRTRSHCRACEIRVSMGELNIKLEE